MSQERRSSSKIEEKHRKFLRHMNKDTIMDVLGIYSLPRKGEVYILIERIIDYMYSKGLFNESQSAEEQFKQGECF